MSRAVVDGEGCFMMAILDMDGYEMLKYDEWKVDG